MVSGPRFGENWLFQEWRGSPPAAELLFRADRLDADCLPILLTSTGYFRAQATTPVPRRDSHKQTGM